MDNKQQYINKFNLLVEDSRVKNIVAEVEQLYEGKELQVHLDETLNAHGGFDWQADRPTIHLNPKTGINKSTICHELLHAIQFKRGYPFIQNNIYNDKRQKVIQELVSNILHIHLVHEFDKRGLQVEEYLSATIKAIKINLKKRKKSDIKNLPILRIHYDASVYLRIFYEAIYLGAQEKVYIGSLFKQYSPVANELSIELRKKIDSNNVLEPAGCAEAIFDCLSLLNGSNISSGRPDFVQNLYIDSSNELRQKYKGL